MPVPARFAHFRSSILRAFDRLPRLRGSCVAVRSIRSRILVIALIPSLFTATLLTAYFAQKQMQKAEQDARAHLLSSARTIAAACQYAMASQDRDLLQRVISREKQSENLDYAQACDMRDIGQSGCGWLKPAAALGTGQIQTRNGVWFALHPVRLPTTGYGATPGERDASGGDTVGYVRVGLSSAPILAARQEAILSAAVLVFGTLVLTFLIGWRLSSRLTRQIRESSDAVERIANGELGIRLEKSADAEIGKLESGINRLAEALGRNQIEMQSRIADATASLAAKKEEAERAHIARSRFFAAASHDLRQPLHALTLFVGALKEHASYSEMRPLVDHIDASVSAMEMLFNSLLDISRLDAGVLEVNREHFPAERIFDRVRKQFAEVAREKQLRFKVRPCHLTLYTDPVLLERILLNLASNAVRYTHDGGVLIAGRRRGNKLLIQVCDTGVGIPESSQEAVFQEFVQLGNPARNRSLGLGLGLAIVSRLARLLDQRIQVKSVPGQGSVFSVEVPLGSGEQALLTMRTQSSPRMKFEGKLAVLVDDEEPILRAMEELFEAWKLDLITARNLAEAVDWLLSSGRTPDILLSDFRLPDNTNGIEVVGRLRQRFGMHLPAVILTGDTAPETLQLINEAGLSIVHKPIQPARLRSLIVHLLSPQPTDAMETEKV